MATKYKSHWIKCKVSPQELILQGTTKPGGREKTPRYIAPNRKAISPIFLAP